MVYAVLALVRFETGRTRSWDLVIFDQAVRAYSGFGAPITPIKGVRAGYGIDYNLLADHVSPIIAALGPLYWIHDGPETLLVAQGLLLAFAVIPLWVVARRILGTVGAWCAAVAYSIAWPVAEALWVDFHETAFAPLLYFWMFERWQAGRRLQALALCLPILLIKEDAGLLVAGFGLYLLTRRGDRRWAAAFIVPGLGWAVFASRVVVPHFGGNPDYYWGYGGLADSFSGLALRAVTHPWDIAATLVTPSTKVWTILLLLLPFLLVPLRSPHLLAALPLLAERMLSDRWPNWWSTDFHYNVFILAPLFLAAIDGASRLPALRAERWWPPALVAASLAFLPTTPFAHLVSPSFYRTPPHTTAAKQAAARIPDGATVDAVSSVGPFLSSRARVLLWDGAPHYAPWAIIDTSRLQTPFPTLPDQRKAAADLLSRCTPVWQQDGYQVLTCRTPPPAPK
ncbi:DUF2079 domain-containing protein [Actinocorallia herbida]|uniref:DUF2079 domain-containing protein n=1 Tax=Actinocorallia herbida TaxID=58109 RepID=UPI001476E55C|nr:DUF2079 domain-containing protein [Actinocorallia herbida]